ncbi:RimJ/RimL family protein N-acetyltransferase [Peribacillus simplex]
MFPVLYTKRLREIRESDAETIFQCLSNDEVTRFYGQDSLKNIGQVKDIVASFAKNYLEKRGFDSPFGFHAHSPKYRRTEIGYEVSPAHWRKGYADRLRFQRH